MKLYATTTSERGKPVTKGGQTVLEIEIEGNRRHLWHVVVLPGELHNMLTVYRDGRIVFEDIKAVEIESEGA